jgi:hypothetical protein
MPEPEFDVDVFVAIKASRFNRLQHVSTSD